MFTRSGEIKLDIILSQRRLRWRGYVHRTAVERIPRQAIEWMPNGRRKRGRPKVKVKVNQNTCKAP